MGISEHGVLYPSMTINNRENDMIHPWIMYGTSSQVGDGYVYIYIHLSQKGKNPSISVYRCSVYTHIYPKKKQHQYQELDPHVSLLNSHVSPGEIGAFPAHLGPILRGCWGRGAATSALRPEAS